jgi:NCS1 family nucleobase:cation symporter-1
MANTEEVQSYQPVSPETGPSGAGDLSIEWRGIQPVPLNDRYGGLARLGAIWFSSNMTPVSILVGVVGTTLGLSLTQTICAIVIGNVLGAIPVGLMSAMGTRTGAPQIALARLPFGKSVSLVSLLAYTEGILFLALAAIFGVQALQEVTHMPFLPALVITFAVEATVSLVGYELIHIFESIAAVLVIIGFIILTIATISKASSIHIHQTIHGSDAVGAFILMAAITFGYTVGWSPYASDYCRYLPPTTSRIKLFAWAAGALVVATVWLDILGVAAGAVLGNGSPTEAMYRLVGGGPLGIFLMFAIFVGVIAYIAPTDYSAGLQALAAGLRMRRPYITGITAVLCGLLTWWLNEGDLATKAENYILLTTYWITPFLAIITIDWWLRSRDNDPRRYDFPVYRMLHSGWKAATALVVGYVVSLPFSDTTVGSQWAQDSKGLSILFGSVSRSALHGGDLAFPVGFLAGGLIYSLLLAVSGGSKIRRTSLASDDEYVQAPLMG